MTNSQIQAGLENGTIAAGTGMILYPDGKLMTNEGNVILPASPERKAIYDSQVENNIPAKVAKFEDLKPDVVIKLDKSVNDDTLANQDIHVEHGIWYDINNKLLQGKPVKAEVYAVYTVSGEDIDAPSDALVTARGTADTAGIAIEGWEGNELIINVTMETGGVTLRMNRTGIIIG